MNRLIIAASIAALSAGCGSEGDESAGPGSGGGSGGEAGGAGASVADASDDGPIVDSGGSGGAPVSDGWPSTGEAGPCTPPDTRPCGSDVGACELGTEQCSPEGQWSGICEGGQPPTSEICDGVDQNCNGLRDDTAFLPSSFDAVDWFDTGFFGLTDPGILATWEAYGAVWDAGTSTVITSFPLQTIWESAAGTPPPSSDLDAMVIVPPGAYGAVAETLFVIAGDTVYGVDGDSLTWASDSVQNVLGFPTIEAITLFRAGDVAGLTEPVLLFVSGGSAYVHTEAGGIEGPASISELFCPPGTTGTCPTEVTSLSRVTDGSTVVLLVQDGTDTFWSPFIVEEAGLRFSWEEGDTGSVPCQN